MKQSWVVAVLLGSMFHGLAAHEVLLKQPLSSGDKQAVGTALTKALSAMTNHAGGSKYEACSSMFPNGKAPADRNSPTWLSCKDQFYASLVSTKAVVSKALRKQPLSSGDKQAVGAALTKALSAMTNHAGGSKYEACSSMFPNGKPPADRNSPTWLSCKDQFYSSFVGTKAVVSKGPTYDHKGYEDDWGTEHRSDEYPKDAEGKEHHPEYEFTPEPKSEPKPPKSEAKDLDRTKDAVHEDKAEEHHKSSAPCALPLVAMVTFAFIF